MYNMLYKVKLTLDFNNIYIIISVLYNIVYYNIV